MDALPQDVAFPLDIAATFFTKLIPDIKKFFISEGVQFPPRPSTENNQQRNQRLLFIRNDSVKVEKNTRTIK